MAERVRKARHLRATLGHKPHQLHTELRNLSREEKPAELVERPEMDEPARDFSRLVAGAMEGDVLRFQARLELLAQASRLGIEPFEANLLIAMVRNRVQDEMEAARKQEARPRHRKVAGMILGFVVLEAGIILGVWWLLTHL